MARVAIVTDSSADLDPRVAAERGVTVAPATLMLGTGAVRARHEDPSDAAPGNDPAWAAQPPEPLVTAYADAFAALSEAHDAIVAVLPSGRLSRGVAAAKAAGEGASRTAPVTVVDSRSVSLGLGFQVLHAAELARRGMEPEEIVLVLLGDRDCYHVAFCVDSVEHLRQSGQVGRSAALIAEALQLKPLLRLDEGQIVPYERARTRTRAIAELADFVCELPAVERCAVLYATDPSDANRLLRVIAAGSGLPPDRLTMHRIGAAVAAQAGPGALGVAVEEADPG